MGFAVQRRAVEGTAMRTNRTVRPKLRFQMSAGGVFVVINLVGDVELHGRALSCLPCM